MDEIRVDHGKILPHFVQEQLRGEGRGDRHTALFVQTSSTHNHIIECVWVPSDVPSAVDAVSAYREQGSRITDPSDFGQDPDTVLSQLREQEWSSRCGVTAEDILKLCLEIHSPFEMQQ